MKPKSIQAPLCFSLITVLIALPARANPEPTDSPGAHILIVETGIPIERHRAPTAQPPPPPPAEQAAPQHPNPSVQAQPESQPSPAPAPSAAPQAQPAPSPAPQAQPAPSPAPQAQPAPSPAPQAEPGAPTGALEVPTPQPPAAEPQVIDARPAPKQAPAGTLFGSSAANSNAIPRSVAQPISPTPPGFPLGAPGGSYAPAGPSPSGPTPGFQMTPPPRPTGM